MACFADVVTYIVLRQATEPQRVTSARRQKEQLRKLWIVWELLFARIWLGCRSCVRNGFPDTDLYISAQECVVLQDPLMPGSCSSGRFSDLQTDVGNVEA